ncbi:hypothetical protein QBC37DRAFT_423043 [Rhypophila decipiens]|uniref:NAD-dependent epimerase/dehydratase domain-containing protein n=1 Tax=Rhypophila decipiens TaxID=261697 RepID=A0AAN7B771_9PEZI|nr:hypothetical protein QBC37DRAFT_423043 [Rhypophila decipiens]
MTADNKHGGTAKGPVLVTGANGYIAGHVIEQLLRAGYAVRGTIRSDPRVASAAKRLREALGDQLASRLEIIQVSDITASNAFHDAAKGTTAIVHIAAPVNIFTADPSSFMHASVEGIKQALNAAYENQDTVQSFVFMSSTAAIISEKGGDYTFTEADWNMYAERMVAEKGVMAAPRHVVYEASKVAAEGEFWSFEERKAPKFAMTAVNPIMCAGPPIVRPESPEEIHLSTKMIWNIFNGVPLDKAAIPGVYQGYVDVRDVAAAVVYTVDHPGETDGERLILARWYSPPQAVADILRREYPDRKSAMEHGVEGAGYEVGYGFPARIAFDGGKVVSITGREYIPWERTVVDTIEALTHLL